MKYEKEIDIMLRKVLFREGMTEQEYQQTIDVLIPSVVKQKLNNDIEKGVENGYTVSQQMDILEQLIKE